MKEGESSTYSVGFFKSLVNSAFFNWIFGGGFGFLYISLWYGFYQVSLGVITIGELTAFQAYVFNIGFGLGQVGGNAAKVYEALGASGRIFYLIDRIPSIPKPPSPDEKGIMTKAEKSLEPPSMTGNIVFNKVSFSYPTRSEINVIDNFDLNITSGTTTGKKHIPSHPVSNLFIEEKKLIHSIYFDDFFFDIHSSRGKLWQWKVRIWVYLFEKNHNRCF